MEKLWINPVVVGLIGLALAPVRVLSSGGTADRKQRATDAALRAHERAYAAWAFDEAHQVWIPGVLRR